ncbi:hypothetical protein [Streptomyces sp. YU58]|uniref:hypothetical protein n=1 Tax=Streptomyces sp. SX92 TaxID=3158972 RepID=UPI0027BAB3C9|nr:hypothetical protein [Streptomyces coralus]WLW58796.1 hypothetical protein QU709_30990 [Streptomyces coralus]
MVALARYKQIKDELGWADFQVHSDTAIRRHQTLVNDESTLVRRELAAAVTLMGDDEHGYPLDQGVRQD